MKKFLTVLLALSVVFTYTFGTAGSVFAASYTLDDYASALTSEKAAQLTYLEKTKNQVVGAYTFDSDGFSTAGYMKAAYEAVADEVIADATTKMDAAINGVLNTTDWPKAAAPDKTVVSKVTTNYNGKDLTTAAGMKATIEAKNDALNKAQAPLSKAFVESKLNVDLSKYNSTDKKYTIYGEPNGSELTAVQAVERAISVAKDAIVAADKQNTDVAKIDAYKTAYNNFKTALGKIKTLADEEFEGGITAGTVEAAVEQLSTVLLNNINNVLKIKADMAADEVVNWSNVMTGELKDFWVADKTTANKGEFFGVAIANTQKVTRSEVAAVNAAYKAAVASAKAPLKAYANGDVSKITALSSKAQQYTALANATSAVSKYADVVAAGEKMKAEYNYGIKKYDDAKVAQAVKAAEQLVYNDLMNGYANKTAESYIIAAAASEGISLEQVNYELQRFNKAVADAAKKMYSDGLTAKNPAVKVSYGDNKTPEADLVYLRATYDSTEYTAWAKIAQKAIADLSAAQSYDEITSIMNKAAEDFNKLLHADVATDVKAARTSYKTALTNYGTLKKGLLDKTAYPAANINAAVEQGKKLIDKATTVDAVKAAYEQGKAIVDGLKTADELKAAKEAVEKQIAALPYTAKLTVADKATVKAAYAAYDAYMNLPGAADIAEASKTLLKEKYNKVNTLEAEAINAKAKAINDQLSKIATGSDADVAARVALKKDADAVKAEAKALNDEISAVNDSYASFLNAVTMTEVTKLEARDFMKDIATDAAIKLVKAAKDGATVEEMKAALDAYNALTDKQKYELDAAPIEAAKVIKEKLISAVESLKITASSTAAKGSITVKWTVKGDYAAADGMRVYKSTKKNSGFGATPYFVTKAGATQYKNTKELKKGTRYYYKVRAYVEIDGVKYYSDWSNKAYRIAK